MNKTGRLINRISGILIVFLALFLSLVGCSDNPSAKNSSNNNSKKMSLDLTLTGEELFVKNCRLCHGIDGKLKLNGAKDLDESVMTLAERIVLVSEGKGAMTPFKKILSEEEIKKVAEYSMTFKKQK